MISPFGAALPQFGLISASPDFQCDFPMNLWLPRLFLRNADGTVVRISFGSVRNDDRAKRGLERKRNYKTTMDLGWKNLLVSFLHFTCQKVRGWVVGLTRYR